VVEQATHFPARQVRTRPAGDRQVSLYLLTADRAATTPSEKEVHLAINVQLETILRRYLVLVPAGQDVPLETELPALGLDSMSALTLLLELEEIFDISFPDSLLNATTFRSAKSLENVVQMLRKDRDGHGTGH
jgi:acyl carrier protein